MDIDKLKMKFEQVYGTGGELFSAFSPGRVNLIGEHTDYNGGFVFPCALSFGTYGVARRRDDAVFHLASENFSLKVVAGTNMLEYAEERDWANYPLGVVKEFQKLGFGDRLSGANMLFYGDIPNGAGLSSSASIEMLTAVLLNEMFDCGLNQLELIKLSQRAENTFVGVNCGIMDQFAVGMGKKGQAVKLRCSDLSYEYVPVALGGNKIVIANTNKRRGLKDSKYNERRGECETAVGYLRNKLDITCLSDVSDVEFEQYKHLIKEHNVLKRAEHVIFENKRVNDAVVCLNKGDLSGFGSLMVQSHNSLRDLYEVTGIELDSLVEEALRINGTRGSRMTGAGFGGCTVSIVDGAAVEEFIVCVGEGYTKKTGLTADFYIAETSDGTKLI